MSSYRNQSTDLLYKSINWYLSEGNTNCWWVNLFQSNVAFHIENSNLICTANETTGFYTKCNIQYVPCQQLRKQNAFDDVTKYNVNFEHIQYNIHHNSVFLLLKVH